MVLPDDVARLTVPAVMPFVPPTDPMARLALLVRLSVPVPMLAATVPMLLLALVRVKVPEPITRRPVAVIAELCVAPAEFRVRDATLTAAVVPMAIAPVALST